MRHYGVALVADCKHGYSVQHDTLWLSLLNGAIDPHPDPDRGEHHFTYSVLPHAAELDEVRRAACSLGVYRAGFLVAGVFGGRAAT
jgi:alpha-mannosidase